MENLCVCPNPVTTKCMYDKVTKCTFTDDKFLETIKRLDEYFLFMVTVDEILSNVTPQQRKLIEELRLLIKNFVPEAVEKVRQKKIAYAVKGKDFMWISVFTDHVDLDFMCGARLISGDLKGRGKTRIVQHMEISSKKDINQTVLKELVEEASKTVC